MVGWSGAWTVGQLWACPSIIQATPAGKSKEDPEDLPLFSRFLLLVVPLAPMILDLGTEEH